MLNQKNKWDHDRERAKYAAGKDKTPSAPASPKDADDWDAISLIGGSALLISLAIIGYCHWENMPLAALPPLVHLVTKAGGLIFFGCVVVKIARSLIFKQKAEPSPAPAAPAPARPAQGSPVTLRDDEFVP